MHAKTGCCKSDWPWYMNDAVAAAAAADASTETAGKLMLVVASDAL